MLEIVIVIVLGRKLAEMAQERGHGRGWAALVLLWFVGEFLGAFVGALAVGDGIALYACALLGAALGGAASYLIVSNLSPQPGSLLGDNPADEMYGHADRNNPYSPSGFGQPSDPGNPYSPDFKDK
ncbi:MAG: hypothetical protein KC457_08525 [Myxococcales bacterium]|nr:hypothetical protein [Myxococcales bacterium]